MYHLQVPAGNVSGVFAPTLNPMCKLLTVSVSEDKPLSSSIVLAHADGWDGELTVVGVEALLAAIEMGADLGGERGGECLGVVGGEKLLALLAAERGRGTQQRRGREGQVADQANEDRRGGGSGSA